MTCLGNYAPLSEATRRRELIGPDSGHPGFAAVERESESRLVPCPSYAVGEEDPLGLREIRSKMNLAMRSWARKVSAGGRSQGEIVRVRDQVMDRVRMRVNQVMGNLEAYPIAGIHTEGDRAIPENPRVQRTGEHEENPKF